MFRALFILFCLIVSTGYSQVKIPVNQIPLSSTMLSGDIFLIVTNPSVANGSTRTLTLNSLLNSSYTTFYLQSLISPLISVSQFPYTSITNFPNVVTNNQPFVTFGELDYSPLTPAIRFNGNSGTIFSMQDGNDVMQISDNGINSLGLYAFTGNGSGLTNLPYTAIINAPWAVQNSINNIDFIVSSTNTQPWKEGRVYYDQATHTLVSYNDRSAVSVNLGEEVLLRGKNLTGTTITNGSAVTITDGSGSIPRLTFAVATTNLTAMGFDCIGVATEDITQGAEGMITIIGTVHNINTDSWLTGSTLWLSTNAGAMTTNPPPSNYARVIMGTVARANQNVGDVFVHAQQAVHVNDIGNFTNIVQSIVTDMGLTTISNNFINVSNNFVIVSNNFVGVSNLVQNINTEVNVLSNNNNRMIVTWPGPSALLAATNTDYLYVASANCTITGVGNGVSGQMKWATLTISNSSAANITSTWSGPGNAVGPNTTNILTIPSGKQGIYSIWVRQSNRTNYINLLEQ